MKKRINVIFVLSLLLTMIVSNPTKINAEDNEWMSLSSVKGTITEVIEAKTRYYHLESSLGNNNGNNPAIFSKINDWKTNDKEVGLTFEFTALKTGSDNRFGVHLFYQDPDNFLTVGYDAGGWFWEYKIDGSGDWMRDTRIKAPSIESTNKLEISLKDNLLIAWNSVNDGEKTELFKKKFDASIIDALSEKSNDIVLKLGTYGSITSAIRVKANNQENIVEPEVPFDRPVLDKYEDYSMFLDFEDQTTESVKDLFTTVMGDVSMSVESFEGSKQLKFDFPDSNRHLISLRQIPLLENFVMEADITLDSTMKRFGPAFRMDGNQKYAYAVVGDAMDEFFTEHFGASNAWSSTTKTGNPLESKTSYHWKVIVEGKVVKLFIDNQLILENEMGNLQTGLGQIGFHKHRGVGTVYIDNLSITKIPPERPQEPNNEGTLIEMLSNSSMQVSIDRGFPRVIDYTLQSGNVMYGQPERIKTVKINGFEIEPKVKFERLSDTRVRYTLEVVDEGHFVNATIQSIMEIEGTTLTYKMTSIENHNKDQSKNTHIIQTIEIPNQSLVSVRSNQDEANIMGTIMSTNTTSSGDRLTQVSENMEAFASHYMYAFVSDSKVSAGVYSNSQYTSSGNGDFTRLNARSKEYRDYVSLGLASSPWIYHKDVALSYKTLELPEVRVALAEDKNHDSKVDWQDGAIAYRSIMNVPVGAESVKDLVAYRIAMNFGSHAQNPFLMTLDGIKKVNLHTDGLGQSILLKGYGSEGHDSGHLNYADIGMRIGGVEEFIKLLEASEKYGAKIGIHVNASETYPESKYFEEDRLLKNADGSYSYGWNWIDQGINIDAFYDLANGRRERFEDLKAVVGDKLDWIYVDVWGNGQSGDNKAWASHQLAKEIQDQGWRVAGEWGYAFEPDSTFQHWAADLTYGGYTLKGINSTVARFIFNHQRDAWVADYPSYSGAADYPLLGGYDMKDFEGWQGRNDYNGYVVNLFENNLPTKYLQHYTVNRWVEGTPITMTNPDGNRFTWVPEMEIELTNESGETVLVQRKSNDYTNNRAAYRSRTITLNGRLVLDGEKYLLPWNWDENGNPLTGQDEKLYHFNKDGGTSTWELPLNWNVNTVKMYELTETGRQFVGDVLVTQNTITISAKPNTAYTLYQGKQAERNVTYGEGQHLVDPGFNTQDLSAWSVEGSGASVVKSQASNDMLKIENNLGRTRLTQSLTTLVPGKEYVAYVGVDNRSDAKAILEIAIGNNVVSNYTTRSIAKNYVKAYAHNTNSSTIDNTSYFQNMFVYFIAPTDGKEVELSLVRDAGSGATFFDDIRVTENTGNPIKSNKVFFQDFENNAQGIYPFVVGNIEGVEDNRTHLSELNAPYTQRGWNDKQVSDVITGKWSLKTNGLTQRQRLVYQTIPQNLRFEPGVEYTVSFKYEAGSTGTYAFVIGDGEVNGKEAMVPLQESITNGEARVFETKIVGSTSGQTWIGIYSTSQAPNSSGSNDKAYNFRGYKDFILDDLNVVNESVEEIRSITITDEKTNISLTGDSTYMNEENILDVIIDDKLKETIEKENLDFDVDVYQLSIQDGQKKVVVPNGKEAIISIPLRTQIKFVILRQIIQPQAIYTMKDDKLVAINFEIEEGNIIISTSKISPIIIDYGFDGSTTTVDKSKLEALIISAKAIDTTKYTQESVQLLVSVLANAEAVYDAADTTQNKIDEHVAMLQDAIDNLVLIGDHEDVDRSKLEAMIQKAKSINATDFTESSVKLLQEALNKAQEVYANDHATQASIDAQVALLQNAIDNLVRVRNNPELPATGVQTYTMIGLSILVLGSMIIILGQRKQSKKKGAH